MNRRMSRGLAALAVSTATFVAFAGAHGSENKPPVVDLSRAVVVTPADAPGPEKAAVRMLVEHVGERTGLRWAVTHEPLKDGTPAVVVGGRDRVKSLVGPLDASGKADDRNPPEGFRIAQLPEGRGFAVLGNDPRGVLFGVGRLIRELRTGRGRVGLPDGFGLVTAPKQSLRGHQLGYRPKTNSYDAWDLRQWERYIRDLAVFGANAVELVPPRTDDDADSPHFPLPPMETMVGMSRILDDYGLDVWVWFPAMDADYTDEKTVAAALKEWGDVFAKLPRLDAVFVPGGDPGHTQPKVLLGFLEKVTEVLHRHHPKAAMWVSPQGFDATWTAEFLDLLKAEPKWLDGVVFGPQVRVPLAELRKAVPTRYPIRGYPDITHSRQCQHPVPDWDLAYAVTEGRESVNPRPFAQAALVKAYLPDTVGFITYSEGCNDDVNKAVWSACGWDPDADVVEVLRQYSRAYLSDRVTEGFAQALLGLERNWSGPLLTNAGVETTLRQLRDLERSADPELLRNWRFQQGLYRGYYDAYIRERLIQETALGARAQETLRNAPAVGSEAAMRGATDVLARVQTEPVALDLRARVFELGEALFQSIRMQLSAPKYQAIAPERGANLDTIDTPLNDRLWLAGEFARIRALPTERERLRALDALVNRTDPGPGGFYDAPGDPSNSPHLVREPTTAADPMFVHAPFHGFDLQAERPIPWRRYIHTFYEAPIRFAYEGLDPHARYRVRVVYAGDSPRARMRLEADGIEVHPHIPKPAPVVPVEFPIPAAATADGTLTLTWTQGAGRGGNGRGCQVSEVWLIRDDPPAR